MISTKIGTQDFSKAVQEHNFHDEKVNYVPATAATPGSAGVSASDKNVGDILNQVANPGGKDPTKHIRKNHNTLDKDDFLKLMLTQMKNQDPMNPMQSHEMAAQLAQFTSLEQLFNVNKNLEGLKTAQDPMQKYEALNFLGKSIKSDTRQIFRNTGDTSSDLRFNLMADAAKIKVTVSDETGQPVKIMEYGALKSGANKVTWSGSNDKDQDVNPGKYMFTVEAFDGSNKKIGVKTETRGTITGVNYTSEGPILMVGDQSVRLQDVQKIEDEALRNQQETTDALRYIQSQGKQKGQLPEIPDAVKAKMTPEDVLKNIGPKPLDTQAKNDKPKVKPEDKPEAKLTGAVMPLEVASANSAGQGGIIGSR